MSASKTLLTKLVTLAFHTTLYAGSTEVDRRWQMHCAIVSKPLIRSLPSSHIRAVASWHAGRSNTSFSETMDGRIA